VLSMPSALADRYYVVAEAGLGGRVIESLLRRVLAPAHGIAGPSPLDDDALFGRMSALAATSPPGAGGVLFVPWYYGSVSPAPDARLKGAFVGMSLETTQADLLRAALEGVCLQMRWLVDEVEAVVGVPFGAIRFTGGGAQSDTWAQILADVLGRPVEQIDNPRQANARGAGFLGFLSTGALSVGDLPALVPVRARYEPNVATTALYDDRLGVFRDLHGRLAEPSERLASASGVRTIDP
jgi:xylulokinase